MADELVFQLKVHQGPQPDELYRLEVNSLVIGRDKYSDIVIDDPRISRHHAKLVRIGDSYVIQDMGSMNGTFVNGVRLGESPQLIQPGQIVDLGGTVKLQYQVASREAAQTGQDETTDIGATILREPEPEPSVEETADRPPIFASRNPYVGPRAFEPDEQKYFYGRDDESAILEGQVMVQRVSLFFAQSGAGKSSLLRAGLLPRLKEPIRIGRGERARSLKKMRVLPILEVGAGVPSGLERTISNIYVFSALSMLYPDVDPDRLAHHSLTMGLTPQFRQAEANDEDGKNGYQVKPTPTLVIFDQFEEIFTHYPDRWQEREDFFHQVSNAIAHFPLLHVLFTMREDYIAELTPYANLLPGKLRERFRLERLKREAAMQAVTAPAESAGRTFAEGVAEALVDNLRRGRPESSDTRGLKASASTLSAYVEPVHLQIVCRQLWEKLPARRLVIEATDVQEFGDVDQALTGFYETTLSTVMACTDLSPRRVRAWFDEKLITPAGTRGLVYKGEQETEGLPNLAVSILNDAYIIRAAVRGGDIWYELAHDRLVGPVQIANQRWREKYDNPLDRATQAWLAAGRDPARLLEGAQLKEAQNYKDAHPEDVFPEEEELLVESYRLEQVRIEEARQAANRRRRNIIAAAAFVAVIVIAAVISGILAVRATQAEQEAIVAKVEAEENAVEADIQRGLALNAQSAAEASAEEADKQRGLAVEAQEEAVLRREQAETLARLALSRQLAVQSENQFNLPSYDLALLLAIESARVLSDTVDQASQGAAMTALHRALTAPVRTTHILPHEGSVVRAVSWSGDERYVMTVSDGENGPIYRVWDVASGMVLYTVAEDTFVNDSTWGPVDSRLLVWTEDGHAVLDGGSGSEQFGLGFVDQAQWNEDGRRIATTSGGEIIIWDATEGSQLLAFETGISLNQFAWNTDGSRLLTTGDSDSGPILQVWDANNGDLLLNVITGGFVNQVLWSGDGSRIAAVIQDASLVGRVWDAQSGLELFSVGGTDFENQATGVPPSQIVWSEDASRLVIVTGSEAVVYDGVSGAQVAFVSDERLAFGGPIIWNETGNRILTFGGNEVASFDLDNDGTRTILSHKEQVVEARWNKDGSRILTAANDNKAHIWDANSGDELLALTHADWVNQAVWNADESRILTASWDRTARIWEFSTGTELLSVGQDAPFDGGITAEWNGAGDRLLTVSQREGSQLARIWDTDAGIELFALNEVSNLQHASWSGEANRILTFSGGGTLQVRDVDGGDEAITLASNEFINQSVWSEDSGRILVLGQAETGPLIHVWDAQSGAELFNQSYSGNQVIWNSPISRILTTGFDGISQEVWNIDSPAEPLILTGAEFIEQAFWTGDSSRILTISNGEASIWDGNSGQLVTTLETGEFVHQATWNRSEDRILTVSNNNVGVWDGNGTPLLTLSDEAFVAQAVWDRDEARILTAGLDGIAHIWDGVSGIELLAVNYSFTGEFPREVSWNRDGTRFLIVGDQGTAVVWDAINGQEIINLSQQEGFIQAAAWNRAGDRLLVTGEGGFGPSVRVWDGISGANLFTLIEGSFVNQALWSESGDRILTTVEDQSGQQLQVWDSDGGRLLLTLAEEEFISQATWSESGSQVLTVSGGETIQAWDGSNGASLFTIGRGESLNQPSLNERGDRLLSIADTTAIVWDAEESGDPLFFLEHDGFVGQAYWSKDGDRIHTISDAETGQQLHVWDAATGQEIGSFSPEEPIGQAIWNQDESRVLIAGITESALTAQIVDGNDGLLLSNLPEEKFISWAILSGDGSRVIILSEDESGQTVRLWDGNSGEALFTLAEEVFNAQFAVSDNGRRIVLFTDGPNGAQSSVWDGESGEQLFTLTDGEFVSQISLSQDGGRIFMNVEGQVRAWNGETGEPLNLGLIGELAFINQMFASDDGSRILTVSDGEFGQITQLWDANGGELLFNVGDGSFISQIAFSGDGRRIVLVTDVPAGQQSTVWDGDSGEQLFTLSESGFVNQVIISRDGGRIILIVDGQLLAWDGDNGEPLGSLNEFEFTNQVFMSGDGSRILTTGEGESGPIARVWDGESGDALYTLAEGQFINQAAWSEDGERLLLIASGQSDQPYFVWDVNTGALVSSFTDRESAGEIFWRGDGDSIAVLTHGSAGPALRVLDVLSGSEIFSLNDERLGNGLQWHEDGNGALAIFGDKLIVWNFESGQEPFTLPHENDIVHAAWNKDGSYIVSTSWDRTARVWDASTGQELFVMTHDRLVNEARWNKDESLILTISEDETARVWDARNGAELAILPHKEKVFSAVWNAKESRILTTAGSGTATVFYTTLKELTEAACLRATRNLSRDEWLRFIGDDLTYRATCPALPFDNG